MVATAAAAENPRAIIGSNSGEHHVTPRAALTIMHGAEYLNDNFGELLPKLLSARKGKRPMGWRKILVYCLKGHVLREDLAVTLDMNSKTVGEDQQRPALWAEDDEEFDEDLEHISQGMHHTICARLNRDRIEARLEYWTAQDVSLRKLEKLKKEHEKAAREADAAAKLLEEQAREKRAKALKKTLKGYAKAEEIVAQQRGVRAITKSLSKEALAVLASMANAEGKGARRSASTLNAGGLKELKTLGLARSAEPHLSKADDPKQGRTEFGARVYAEAIELELIEKPKKKKAPEPE